MKRLQPTRIVISFDEELKVFPKLVVAVVVVAFDSRFFEGAVHPLHLAIGPWVVGLGQSVFDVVLAADLIEAVNPVMGGPAVSISWQVGELDAALTQVPIPRCSFMGLGWELICSGSDLIGTAGRGQPIQDLQIAARQT